MTDREAVERVKEQLDNWFQYHGALEAEGEIALTRVLALAQRPYALGEGERDTLASMLENGHALEWHQLGALKAALALQEPFTREDALRMQRWAANAWASSGPWGVDDDDLRRKLDAYIEARWPANAEPR